MTRKGVLLANLGSPDSASVDDVRTYLDEFLMDKRVLDVPFLIRRMIVSWFILPKRPRNSAEAYQSIWWDEGSPLVVISRRLQRLLQAEMEIPIGLAMRYGNPSIEYGIQELLDKGVDEILLVPLYPHFAMATVETVVVAAHEALKKLGARASLDILPPFYADPNYIDSLVTSAAPYLNAGYDHVLVSYHGLPERHLRKSDTTGAHCLRVEDCCSVSSTAHATCYRHQVLKTTELFVEKANIPADKYSVSFQSRLGKDKWLDPNTELEIQRLAKEGAEKLLVICPAFVSDCLETLEEIGIRGRETFLEAGGKDLELIPCLNEHPAWVSALKGWIESRTGTAAPEPAKRRGKSPAS